MSDAPGDKRSHQSPPVTITPYPDGPYLVRGDFVVQDQEGNEMPLERRTIALCRCGKSRMRPFCDGTHKLIGFEAPSAAEPWPGA
ncbi:MAG TPA: CDGSH iron-sulfur domain-containing protein [Solirubrobacterales bacterium]|jgi:CDGSH-type Zn-finger protein|nr:CDGSH iron-sulfur domain-containing protein [Solirubrobacterales bacterium]